MFSGHLDNALKYHLFWLKSLVRAVSIFRARSE
jgi:hypothetical protein